MEDFVADDASTRDSTHVSWSISSPRPSKLRAAQTSNQVTDTIESTKKSVRPNDCQSITLQHSDTVDPRSSVSNQWFTTFTERLLHRGEKRDPKESTCEDPVSNTQSVNNSYVRQTPAHLTCVREATAVEIDPEVQLDESRLFSQHLRIRTGQADNRAGVNSNRDILIDPPIHEIGFDTGRIRLSSDFINDRPHHLNYSAYDDQVCHRPRSRHQRGLADRIGHYEYPPGHEPLDALSRRRTSQRLQMPAPLVNEAIGTEQVAPADRRSGDQYQSLRGPEQSQIYGDFSTSGHLPDELALDAFDIEVLGMTCEGFEHRKGMAPDSTARKSVGDITNIHEYPIQQDYADCRSALPQPPNIEIDDTIEESIECDQPLLRPSRQRRPEHFNPFKKWSFNL